MGAKDLSKRTADQMRQEIADTHLSDWAQRPLAEITAAECKTRHRRLTTNSGPYVANRVMRYLRAVYNHARKTHPLPHDKPTDGVDWNKERRRTEPIPWEDLPAWRERVEALANSVRRDYQLFVLYTGLRANDAATVRWEHVDLEAGTLHRPRPKGGVDRSFTVPISSQTLELLQRRREENEVLYSGTDWVFPARSRSKTGEKVTHLKEVRLDSKALASEKGWPDGPHRLRDTYATAALEADVGLVEIKILMNHSLPAGDVTVGYMKPSLDRLRPKQQAISDFLELKIQKNQTEPNTSDSQVV